MLAAAAAAACPVATDVAGGADAAAAADAAGRRAARSLEAMRNPVMVRLSRVLLVLGLLAGACCAPRAFGQGVPVSAEPLPDLPTVADIPRSLYAPPPPQPPPVCLESDHYLEVDPRLDPPDLPLPGRFSMSSW